MEVNARENTGFVEVMGEVHETFHFPPHLSVPKVWTNTCTTQQGSHSWETAQLLILPEAVF